MSYRIEISPEARLEIRQLPGHVRAQALKLLEELSENPRPARAKELREQNGIWRIWLAGRWRVVYAVDDALVTVLVVRVRRKENIDYDNV